MPSVDECAKIVVDAGDQVTRKAEICGLGYWTHMGDMEGNLTGILEVSAEEPPKR